MLGAFSGYASPCGPYAVIFTAELADKTVRTLKGTLRHLPARPPAPQTSRRRARPPLRPGPPTPPSAAATASGASPAQPATTSYSGATTSPHCNAASTYCVTRPPRGCSTPSRRSPGSRPRSYARSIKKTVPSFQSVPGHRFNSYDDPGSGLCNAIPGTPSAARTGPNGAATTQFLTR